MKISVLLPYKEDFAHDLAGAVSLFVSQISKKSKYRKSINIYGNTRSKKYLLSNYINIHFKKNILQSSSKNYVQSFLNIKNILTSDIIEVHNRPNYIKYIKKKFHNKIFLYFHNDPLTMEGSTSIDDRIYLINNINKLIFNSNWSKNRFFLDLPKNKVDINKIDVCYQSSNKTKIDFSKKEKIISFIGKLNSAKGYDVFGKAVLEILDKYKDWSAVVIGDEAREKLVFSHNRLKILGFKDNKFILNLLKKISISVICSRWEEPFGRVSLEAASRGCATITSTTGGLPETSNFSLKLDKLNTSELINSLNDLIKDKSYLLKKQKQNYKGFFLTHEYVASLVDSIRSNQTYNFNFHKKKHSLKIIHITNFNNRFEGRLHYNTSKRLNNGFIRNGHNVLTISDRDIISHNKSLNDVKGTKFLQETTINNIKNFKPDLIILGHADSINIETINYIKSSNIKIAQWFLDPVGKHTPDHIKNRNRLIEKSNYVDASFLTTDPRVLNFDTPNTYFIPNPADHSFETLNNYERDTEYDLFFALSHGVHRGILKEGKFDDREIFLKKLIKFNKNVSFDFYGINNREPIWGDEFINRISKSSMGLNLSRGKPVKYYSSDRIAQLMGNGLLTFIDVKTYYNDFFSNKEIVTYKNVSDLCYLLQKYKKDTKQRKLIAKNGKIKYMKYFNSNIISKYIVEKTMNDKISKDYLWLK
jgi:glycosyltransferase involved in cell wall biosynthesis